MFPLLIPYIKQILDEHICREGGQVTEDAAEVQPIAEFPLPPPHSPPSSQVPTPPVLAHFQERNFVTRGTQHTSRNTKVSSRQKGKNS